MNKFQAEYKLFAPRETLLMARNRHMRGLITGTFRLEESTGTSQGNFACFSVVSVFAFPQMNPEIFF